ncbi:MAG TPA: tRNA (adenosine(37)-N6)-dimethylallyltransferase MiaA [Gaiellaceae bacterium]|nr:tRNA (adenosine(37)-N6)-dimethylallyltransferase MiaA [Gaiellaceae bacterium]
MFGPTASGKTAVAEQVARSLGGAVVSADSMQAYRGVPIITAQPERPTALVAIWPLSHEGSIGEYAELAHVEIDRLLAEGRVPVVAGGTGLYFRAALAELDIPPSAPPEARERWEAAYDADPAAVYTELADRDPEAAAVVHANDRRRVVRALELTDAGFSLRRGESRLWSKQTRHPTRIFGLDVPADVLEARIADRARAMVAAGAVREARRALAGEISTTARQMLGLQELAERGNEALDALIVGTRQFAAYQRKWMRRISGIELIDGDRPPDLVAKEIAARLA